MEKIDAMINLAGELYEATRSIERLKESDRFKRYSDIGPQGSCSSECLEITVGAEKINQLMDLLKSISHHARGTIKLEFERKLNAIEEAESALHCK